MVTVAGEHFVTIFERLGNMSDEEPNNLNGSKTILLIYFQARQSKGSKFVVRMQVCLKQLIFNLCFSSFIIRDDSISTIK